MSKEEFISYISISNPGFFKTRKNHIQLHFPEILLEIEHHLKNFNITPINFNDALHYYVNNSSIQNTCVCGKPISFKSIYCSNKCKKEILKKF